MRPHHLALLQVLLDAATASAAGIDPKMLLANAKNVKGDTALHIACRQKATRERQRRGANAKASSIKGEPGAEIEHGGHFVCAAARSCGL